MMGMAGTAGAAPFKFTFTTTMSDTNADIPGASLGDTLTLNVIADNGGTSLFSQLWQPADIQSATVTVGTYQADYISPYFVPSEFRTDISGALTQAFFTDNSSNNSDLFGDGGGVALFSNSLRDFNGNADVFFPTITGSASNWTVTPVPEPSTLSLVATGLALLAFLGWRRRGSVQLKAA